VKPSSLSRFAGVLAGLLLPLALAAADIDATIDPLATVRIENSIRLNVGGGHLNLAETIVVRPIRRSKEDERPGNPNFVHILISPLWIQDGDTLRPAFTVTRPYINISHGRVQRFVLARESGETVRFAEDMTPDCRYVLSLSLGHVIPERLTVSVTMSTPRGIRPDAELLYTASNDGQPLRSGAPESFYTTLRINAEPMLSPWQVVMDEKVLPRADSSSVRLDRNVSHTIRFGIEGN